MRSLISTTLALATIVVLTFAILRSGGAAAHGDITVLDCQPSNVGEGEGLYYGVTFTVDQPFVAIEMQMFGTYESGLWFITAELFRSSTFVGPSEATTTFSVELPDYQTGQNSPATAHMDFGYIPVTGTEAFSFRFLGWSGPRDPLFRAGAGDNCPNLVMHNEMYGDELTDSGSEPFFRVLTTNDPLNAWGDMDCTGGVSALDALAIFIGAADEPLGGQAPCVGIGDKVSVNGTAQHTWGDLNCGGGLPNELDSLLILRFLAGVPQGFHEADCPSIAQAVLVGP